MLLRRWTSLLVALFLLGFLWRVYPSPTNHLSTSMFIRPNTIKQGEALFGVEFERATLITEDWKASTSKQLAGALFFCREELVNLLKPAESSPVTVTLLPETTKEWPSSGYECYSKWEMLSSSEEITDVEAHSQWRVYICKHGMRASIRAKKLGNCTAPLDESLDNPELHWNQISNAKIGPEEFTFFLEGAEILDLGSALKHLGECHYETQFQLTIPGRYRLQMMWTRTQHLATKETQEWPDAFVKYPLGSINGIFLEFSGDGNKAWKQVLTTQSLPVCSKHTPAGLQGRWVITKPFTNEYLKPRKTPGRREGFITYVQAEDYVWVPYTCKLLELKEYAEKCDLNTFTLLGDSHGRIFFQGLVVEMCGGKDESVLATYSSNPWKAMEFTGNCTGFDNNKDKPWMWKYLPIFTGSNWNDVTKALMENKARVLANFGQHTVQQPSSYAKTYLPYMQTALRAVAELTQAERDRLAWFQTPVMPYDSGGFVRGYKDGRTIGRIAVLNRVMDAKLRELNVQIAPLMSMTHPLYISFADRAHFPKWVYVHTARVAFSQYC